MKQAILITLLLNVLNAHAQVICADISGPNYAQGDSLMTLEIDLSKYDCKGKLFYSLNDSLMSDMRELKVKKDKAELSFKASQYPGMHSVYFKYQCKKVMHKFNHMYSVAPVYAESQSHFNMPDFIESGKKFKVELINLGAGDFRLICESCDTIKHIGSLVYELIITNTGEHAIWVEEFTGLEWEETYSRDIIIE